MKLSSFNLKLVLVICIVTLSLSLNEDNFPNRFLQEALTSTTSGSTETPFDLMLKELKFSLTNDGKSTLQMLLDSEWAAADSDKNSTVSGNELTARLKALITKYKIPENIDTKPMFTTILIDVDSDKDSNYSRTEFDKAISTGINYLIPYLAQLKGTPYEKQINAEINMQAIQSVLNQEKNSTKNDFQLLWTKVSQGLTSINVATGIEAIGAICYQFGYPTSQSESIKTAVTAESKNNSLVRNDFEAAARKAYSLTYSYIESTLIPETKKEIADYLAKEKANMVRFLNIIYNI